MIKIPQQKWYHFRKGSKILNKNSTISEKGQKSSTEMVPFKKMVKFLNKMVPFQAVKSQNASTKWYHFRKGSKILDKNGTISEKGQNSSTKMVPFQKRIKNPQQKLYHFRKGSKILDKKWSISEKGQNFSAKMRKWYNFRRRSNIVNKNGTNSGSKGS